MFSKVGHFPIDFHRYIINFVMEIYGISENRCLKKTGHLPIKISFSVGFSNVLHSFEKKLEIHNVIKRQMHN